MLVKSVKVSSEFWQGFRDTLPLWIGVAPFGIAYALAARTAGLDAWQTIAMSLFVFAGASQLTATGLFASGAAGLSIVITTFIVNIRHILFSASLVAPFRQVPLAQKMLVAFGLTDESYAVSVRRIIDKEAGPNLLLGSNISIYICWQISTLIGVMAGNIIPDSQSWGLALVFPLTFIVLLIPYLKTRPAWAAVVVAAILALLGRLFIGGSWYLLIAAIGGSLAGAWVEARQEKGKAAE